MGEELHYSLELLFIFFVRDLQTVLSKDIVCVCRKYLCKCVLTDFEVHELLEALSPLYFKGTI